MFPAGPIWNLLYVVSAWIALGGLPAVELADIPRPRIPSKRCELSFGDGLIPNQPKDSVVCGELFSRHLCKRVSCHPEFFSDEEEQMVPDLNRSDGTPRYQKRRKVFKQKIH
ncbi:hypothetical protein PTTG_26849 [Puccinia triticina 1-1 BBBD Race 1]|uniref:Secreted protein n=2 Tax=Puccinia triticina TaxID=208348 RepID=A0A180GRF3_PUCT1|nr:uncharacterized protein PtA15_2A270 [Puccinia triticina]OAV94862.1 hypothetical protein PTTG_26849 [Puccinia triticina 1-1 BBBD Race 1]WAQ81957.1 hypothetical protein PtA15_2A270 [Puccinia triticina]WAR52841.1 hypothetical protein PtB15_2B269 [Puccinia triticina]